MFSEAQALLQRLLQMGFNALAQIANILANFYKDGCFGITPEGFDILINASIKLEKFKEATQILQLCKFLGWLLLSNQM